MLGFISSITGGDRDMKTIVLSALLALLPVTSTFANDMVNNLKAAPEALCEGNSQHKACIDAAKRLISATYQVTKAGTLCMQNKDKLHLLGDDVQKQCSGFIDAMDYMDTLKK